MKLSHKNAHNKDFFYFYFKKFLNLKSQLLYMIPSTDIEFGPHILYKIRWIIKPWIIVSQI